MSKKESYNYLKYGIELRDKKIAYNIIQNLEKKKKLNINKLNRLANTYFEIGDYINSKKIFKKALLLKTNSLLTLNNFANFYKSTGDKKNAISLYLKIFKLNKNNKKNLKNLLITYMEQKKYSEVINIIDQNFKSFLLPYKLEALLRLKNKKKFIHTFKKHKNKIKNSIGLAAISNYGLNQFKSNLSYDFCNNPLDHLFIFSIVNNKTNYLKFADKIINEIEATHAKTKSSLKISQNGSEPQINLFSVKSRNLKILKRKILKIIKKYKSNICNNKNNFSSAWPKNSFLNAWHVRTKKGSFQPSHIHIKSWLSGVFYLKVPKINKKNGGSVLFGLRGYDYPVYDKKTIRAKEIFPKNGDVVLFPSCLFHSTKPLKIDNSRDVIAFDLIPKRDKVKFY